MEVLLLHLSLPPSFLFCWSLFSYYSVMSLLSLRPSASRSHFSSFVSRSFSEVFTLRHFLSLFLNIFLYFLYIAPVRFLNSMTRIMWTVFSQESETTRSETFYHILFIQPKITTHHLSELYSERHPPSLDPRLEGGKTEEGAAEETGSRRHMTRTKQQNHSSQVELAEYLIQMLVYVKCVDHGINHGWRRFNFL